MAIIKVKTGGITADAVTDALIADDVVGTEHLTANEVDTAALGADAVTGAELADNAVNSEHYTDGSVDTAHIADANVTTAKLASTSVTAAKLNNDIISGTAALTSAPDDTDEFLVSDAGTLKRIDYSLIKSESGLTLIKETTASNVASVSFVHGTSDVVFDTTYKLYLFTFTDINMAGDEAIFLRPLLGGSSQTSGFLTAQAGNYVNTGGSGSYADIYQNAFIGSSGEVEQDTPMSGYAYFVNAGGSSKKPHSFGQFMYERSNSNYYNISYSSYYDTAVSNFNGFIFTNNGGSNITSGNFKLYGLK